jgi:hypothetical protein
VRRLRGFGLAALAALAAACSRSDATPESAAGQAADSVVPREVALQRFREGLDSVAELSGGARSRDELVRRFIRALETRDTAEVRTLAMTKAEFAWLYYPTTPQGLPPYDLSPEMLWFLTFERSQQGIAHAFEQRGGQPLRYVGYACDPDVSIEGQNRVQGPCLVRRLQAPGDTVAERLFGLVIERGGRFKFVSYANRLD